MTYKPFLRQQRGDGQMGTARNGVGSIRELDNMFHTHTLHIPHNPASAWQPKIKDLDSSLRSMKNPAHNPGVVSKVGLVLTTTSFLLLELPSPTPPEETAII